MAKISYHGILDSLKSIFEADSLTSGAKVEIEQDPVFGLGSTKNTAIVLSLTDRTPFEEQSLRAGKRQSYFLSISVWVIGFSGKSFEDAARVRDNFLGDVELVLMNNRTISDKVTAHNLNGGRFASFKDDTGQAWVAMAETVISAQVSAIS